MRLKYINEFLIFNRGNNDRISNSQIKIIFLFMSGIIDFTKYFFENDKIIKNKIYDISKNFDGPLKTSHIISCFNNINNPKYVNQLIKYMKELQYEKKEIDKIKNKEKFNILQNIFSVRNEYSKNIKHKIITILGIKIKFKVKNLRDKIK